MCFSFLSLLSLEVYQTAVLGPGLLCPDVLSPEQLPGVQELASSSPPPFGVQILYLSFFESYTLQPGCLVAGFPHSLSLSVSSYARVNPLNFAHNSEEMFRSCLCRHNKSLQVSAAVLTLYSGLRLSLHEGPV